MRKLAWVVALPCSLALACGSSTKSFGPAPNGGSSGKAAAGGAAGESNEPAGGSSAAAGNPSSGGVALGDLPEAYADAYCAVLARCEGVFYDLITAYEDCSRVTAERLRQAGLDALSQAVDEGRVEYHPEKVPACLDAVRTRACDELDVRGLAECEAAVTGNAAEGEPCELNEECAGSLMCETGEKCPGTCVERYTAGIACTADDDCADGLVCSTVTRHCVAPAQTGEPCEGGVEAQCEAGLFCGGADAEKMQPGTCAPLSAVTLGKLGQACDPAGGKLCASGLSCVLAGMNGDALTWECQTKAASGGSCGAGLPEDCPDGEYCPLLFEIFQGTFSSTCVPLPKAGESCATRPLDAIMPRCEPYARCGADLKCIALRDLGQSCTSDAVCYSGRCANGACEPAHACR